MVKLLENWLAVVLCLFIAGCWAIDITPKDGPNLGCENAKLFLSEPLSQKPVIPPVVQNVQKDGSSAMALTMTAMDKWMKALCGAAPLPRAMALQLAGRENGVSVKC